MFAEGELLTQAQTTHIVTQYLLGQGWGLVDPAFFAERIWQTLAPRGLQQETAVHTVHTATWQQYAIILHDACRQPDNSSQYQQAWAELNDWLQKQVHQITSHPQEQQDIVQETLLELQAALQRQALRVPRTLWAYALQVLRHKQIDRHRKRTAQKRGEDEAISLEQLAEADDNRDWEERLPREQNRKHLTESIMADQETRAQLQTFFRRYLPTELQQQVALAHFLDGLSPKEIAALMGKRPHEIRLLKVRIVRELRELPPPIHQELMTILDKWEEGGQPHE